MALVFRREDYEVRSINQTDCAALIVEHHYARGCSHTSTFRFGLFRREDQALVGATMWLPPTRRSCEKVDHQWRAVMGLSRMVVVPGVPKNACSFMLSRAVKVIVATGRYRSFVTYADAWKNHIGGVYLAAGWIPTGYSKPTPKWIEPSTGRQIAQQSTKTRSLAEMDRLGYERIGDFRKRRFVYYPLNDVESKLLRLEAHIAWLVETMRGAG